MSMVNKLGQKVPRSVDSGPLSSAVPQCQNLEVVGGWRTQFGIYRISLDDEQKLCFEENSLYAILQPSGEWYSAVVRDSSKNGAIFGFVRLKRDGECMVSNFKKTAEERWEGAGDLQAEPLPFLQLHHAELNCEAERSWQAESCCICLEPFQLGEVYTELVCHHLYHKSCIDQWFLRNGSCPLRCSAHPTSTF